VRTMVCSQMSPVESSTGCDSARYRAYIAVCNGARTRTQVARALGISASAARAALRSCVDIGVVMWEPDPQRPNHGLYRPVALGLLRRGDRCTAVKKPLPQRPEKENGVGSGKCALEECWPMRIEQPPTSCES